MKKLILGCVLASLVACSSPSKPPTPPTSSEPSAPTLSDDYHGEAIRTFEGKLENYSLGKALLKAYEFDDPSYDDNRTLGLGQIEADGSFTFEFKEAVEETGSYSFICREDLYSETATGIQVASASQIFIQGYEDPFEGSIYGIMAFATFEPWYFSNATPENGDKIISWDYAFEDSELTRTCDNGVTFDISLKTGWNTVAGVVDESSVGFEMAGITDNKLTWFFTPVEIQEEPGGSGTADTGSDDDTGESEYPGEEDYDDSGSDG